MNHNMTKLKWLRGRWQFGLRSLLLFMLIAALGSAWYGWRVKREEQLYELVQRFNAAMDRTHLRELKGEAPKGTLGRISRFLDYSAAWQGLDVPDPYYGGDRGFEEVLDMVEEASERLLEAVLADLSL